MSIKLKGSSDGSVSLDAPADTSPTGTDVSLTLPTSAGGANQFIKNGSTAGELEHSSMVEDSNGRVGIGTSIPGDYDTTANDLVVGEAGAGDRGITIASGTGSRGTVMFADGVSGLGEYKGYLQYNHNGDYLAIATNNSEAMRIDSGGHIFSGTTTNFPGVGNTNTGFMLENANDGKTAFISRNDNVALYLNRNTDGTLIRFHRSGTEEGYITIDTTAISLVSTSDYRLKENAVSIADGITRVKQLQPKRFNFIADPSKTVDGFMAHEVQTVVPEAAFGEHDAVDAEGNPEYQGLDQSKLVPLLTAALQEAIAKIETLETKVAALEAAS